MYWTFINISIFPKGWVVSFLLFPKYFSRKLSCDKRFWSTVRSEASLPESPHPSLPEFPTPISPSLRRSLPLRLLSAPSRHAPRAESRDLTVQPRRLEQSPYPACIGRSFACAPSGKSRRSTQAARPPLGNRVYEPRHKTLIRRPLLSLHASWKHIDKNHPNVNR